MKGTSHIMTAQGILQHTADGVETAILPPGGSENHASFIATLPDGRLGCVWFAGSREGNQDVCIWFSRLDGGRWSEPVKVSAEDGTSHQNPVLVPLPNGELELLYTAQDLSGQASAVVLRQTSSDSGATWSEATTFVDEVGSFIRQPELLLDGRRILPIFHCPPREGSWHGDADSSSVLVSTDDGQSWTSTPVPDSDGSVHMVILQLSDTSFVALYRSRAADVVRRSTSADGEHWSAPEATDLPNNNSSITAIRYPTPDAPDRLLLVGNPVGRAPEQESEGAVWGLPRVPLTLLTSVDLGRTWTTVLDLETQADADAAGLQPRRHGHVEISYPLMVHVPGDAVHVTYTWNREAIKHARLPEPVIASLLAR